MDPCYSSTLWGHDLCSPCRIIVFWPHIKRWRHCRACLICFWDVHSSFKCVWMQLQIFVVKLNEWEGLFMGLKSLNHPPSTRDVSSVTLAALRLPAGRLRPIFSSFSRRHFPPFLDFALWEEKWTLWGRAHMRHIYLWIIYFNKIQKEGELCSLN